MKILAIDTSGVVASVAVLSDDKILGEISTNYKQNHSTTIMPMVDNMLNMLEIDINDIDYFACTKGPGSFTGLRIGVSTVKAMAHALNKKIVSVSTLETLAYNIFDREKFIVPIIDAKSERIFSGIYKRKETRLHTVLQEDGTTIRDLLEYIRKNNIDPIFLGEGARIYRDIILSYFSEKHFAPIHLNMQRASSLATLALEYIKNEEYISYNEVEIEYLRKPQAQRELE